VPDVQELSRIADLEHHVVLEFPRSPWRKLDKRPIISFLTASLPEHSVFDSGGDERTEWITVTPVISQAQVLSQLDQIKLALTAYTEACATLIAQRKSGTLSPNWTEDEHGGDVCFQNKATGQTVEAPLCGAPTLDKVDAYFFAVFVKTTGAFPAVAALLHHDFHDARRLLDVLINQREAQQLPAGDVANRAAPEE
jgi:hypothetical protein